MIDLGRILVVNYLNDAFCLSAIGSHLNSSSISSTEVNKVHIMKSLKGSEIYTVALTTKFFMYSLVFYYWPSVYKVQLIIGSNY